MASEFMTLYTVDKRCRVLKKDWNNPDKTILCLYNQFGRRVDSYYREGDCLSGLVHRENLSPTKAEAVAKRESIYRELFPSLY